MSQTQQQINQLKVEESKRLYDDLNLIFNKNPEINEIGFIISSKEYDGQEDKPFILLENKLGISFKWITKLYSYSFTYFIELKSHFQSKWESLPTRHQQLLIAELLQVTKVLLIINAENSTALNLRKKLINLNFIKHVDEIKFLNLMFTKHPKSGEAWAHRRWVIKEYIGISDGSSDNGINQNDIEIELSICKRVAEIYPKNYYSWTHRWWILKNQSVEVILKDFETIQDWVKRNVSDYCGYHHRYLILSHLFNLFLINNNNNNTTTEDEMKIYKIWENEFQFILKIIKSYPGHESAWSYKRVLTLFWLENNKNNNKSSNQITNIEKECEFVDSILQEVDSSYYENQKALAQRYLLSIYQFAKKQNTEPNAVNEIDKKLQLLLIDLKISFPNQLNAWNSLIK